MHRVRSIPLESRQSPSQEAHPDAPPNVAHIVERRLLELEAFDYVGIGFDRLARRFLAWCTSISGEVG